MDPPEVSSPPHTLPSDPTTSNSQLATLLSDAYLELDAVKRDLSLTRKRADKAERLLQSLTTESTGSPPNGNPHDQQAQKLAQNIKLIEEYEDRLAQAEIAREEADARRRVAQDAWEQLERYFVLVESRTKDARIAFTRISDGSVAPLVLPPAPPHITTVGGSLSAYSSSQIMAPPSLPSRQPSRHQQSSRQFPSLPPHPVPNPNPNLSPSAGTRRPRTPSLDGMYNAAQPPSKRSRANTDDQRAREPRPSYSESYVGSMQQQQQQQHLPHSSDSREYRDQLMAQAARQQQLIQRSQAPRIIKYADPHGPHPSQIPDSHRHSRSSSTSSLDVDEMLLRATTGDEHGGAPNGTGPPYIDSPHHHQLNINQRRRTEREGESPRPHSANNDNGHPGHISTATNPYPQHPSNVSYPANQSAPVMNSLRQPTQSSQNQVIQTHIFAPVVTGAPTKKTKFPNTIQAGSGNGVGLPGSGASLDGGAPTVTVPYASTNAQGQRICRQCGMVGRYKDGKCVEKWGPGPMGPGTVCDRCRKKMKRVERRGTLESQQQQQVANHAAQHQQHQPRSTSHQNMPLSQGSDRSIHRSDTILTHQPSHSPSAFSQSQSHPQSTRDRDTSSSHTQSNIRSSLSNLHPSSSASVQASVPHSTKHGSHQRPQPAQSPPPPIAALKESQDDDDEHHDPDQLPISNIGRGGGSGAPSRSSSRNARVRGATGSRPTPPITRSSDNINGTGTLNKKSPLGSSMATAGGGSGGSPGIAMEVDEMDADADADAEAEAEVESEAEAEILGAVAATSRNRPEGEDEGGDDGDGDGDGEADADADAELLEAVDAAEANSSSSHGGGERMRMKSES